MYIGLYLVVYWHVVPLLSYINTFVTESDTMTQFNDLTLKFEDINHINVKSDLFQPLYTQNTRINYNKISLRLLSSSREIYDASVRIFTDRQLGAHRFTHRRRIYVGRWLFYDGRWHRRTYDGLMH